MTAYVIRNGQLVEKHRAPPRSTGKSPLVISDIEPFQTQDGHAITSRSDLRSYEQANGVRQVGNDWTGSEKPAFWDSHMAKQRGR